MHLLYIIHIYKQLCWAACHFGSVLPDDSDGTAHIYPRCLAGTPWVLGKGEGRKPNKKHAAALRNHPLVGERLGEQSSKQRSRRPLGRDECFSNDVGVYLCHFCDACQYLVLAFAFPPGFRWRAWREWGCRSGAKLPH